MSFYKTSVCSLPAILFCFSAGCQIPLLNSGISTRVPKEKFREECTHGAPAAFVSSRNNRTHGVRFPVVIAGSLMHALGLRSGDIIIAIEDRALSIVDIFQKYSDGLAGPDLPYLRFKPNPICNTKSINLTVERFGQRYTINATMADSDTDRQAQVTIVSRVTDGSPSNVFELIDPVSDDNPINEQTGRPYTDSQMRAFSKLSERFPSNTLIPKHLSTEEKVERMQEAERLASIEARTPNCSATATEIEYLYRHKTRVLSDRIQLLRFTQMQAEEADIKARFEKLIQDRLSKIQEMIKEKESHIRRCQKVSAL